MSFPQFLKVIFLSLFIFMIGVASLFAIYIFSPTISQDYGKQYTVYPGASIQTVEKELAAQDIINHPLLFRILMHVHNKTHSLKAGEYYFAKDSSPLKILNQMMTGTGLVQHEFTIIAGWNFQQVRQALNKEVLLQHTTEKLSDTEIMQKLGQSGHPEGLFFPDTYFYTMGNSDLSLLKRAFKKMQNHLDVAWNTRVPNLLFKNSYEALIAASLVEKEAHVNEERPIIAGVLINRLRKNMLLQFDPTVIYALGDDYEGTLHKKDLTFQSPYNTYVTKGLPPTPIAMPSLASINAVMHPDNNDYYYFVARGDGHHQFTKSLDDHHQAVKDAVVTRNSQPYFNSGLVKQYIKGQPNVSNH